ncbi:DUF4386 family protein [Rhodocytophaga aerolata]|uniref:DUF4386 family protein n=1 Tax=Rhodocytophaga aerolata TaxID=455078 RepID=A0ABT8R738_9BACT|nr:DUF4386 family protein [Rhodocytophaga aerolata]MDO1446500.1 DUF4386 family protein [Rhodocytophaga aerolata]
MKAPSLLQVTGMLLLLSGLMTGICFEGLRQQFFYPDILRMPAGYVLSTYHRGGVSLQLLWYGMTLGSLLLLIICLLLHNSLASFQKKYVPFITGVGVLAGLFNTLGFIRWVFLVPSLAASYVDPDASMATKQTISLIFEAFHQYLGFSLGEHLGFLFLACWGSSFSLFLYANTNFPKWLHGLGIVSSLGTFLGLLEATGWEFAAQVVSISSSFLILWIALVGFYLYRLPTLKFGRAGLYRKVGQTSFERVN